MTQSPRNRAVPGALLIASVLWKKAYGQMAKNDKTKTQPPDMRSRAPQFSGKMPVNKSNPAEAGLQKYILGKNQRLLN